MNIEDATKIAKRMIDLNIRVGLPLLFSEREAIKALLESIEHYREVIISLSSNGTVSFGELEDDGGYFFDDDEEITSAVDS